MFVSAILIHVSCDQTVVYACPSALMTLLTLPLIPIARCYTTITSPLPLPYFDLDAARRDAFHPHPHLTQHSSLISLTKYRHMRKRNAHWREIVALVTGMPLLSPRLQNCYYFLLGSVRLMRFAPVNVFAKPWYPNIAQ
jgi:hypothetical protein